MDAAQPTTPAATRRAQSNANPAACAPVSPMSLAAAAPVVPVATAAEGTGGSKPCMNAADGACGSVHHPNCVVLQSRALRLLFSKLRDESTSVKEFAYTGNRLMGMLAEEALAHLPGTVPADVRTPCGVYHGLVAPPTEALAAVSIVRAGDSLLRAVRKVAPGIAVGKVLIQRDEATADKRAVLSYMKLPRDMSGKAGVLLVDPMLATGGSACKAIEQLVLAGVPPERILFVNVVCCPEGLRRLAAEWPAVRVVTAAVDEGLNEHKFLVPGLGDFGDRYFGTEG